jgi:hypothetical protein
MASQEATAVPIPAQVANKPKPVVTAQGTHGAKVPERPEKNEKPSNVPKPDKILPTERITVARQLDILRGYAAASNNGAKPAPVNEVATIMGMALSTVSLANAFLASIGLIIRSDAGSYTPAAEVIAFVKAWEWDKETASYKLGPLLLNAWFGKALFPRLQFNPIEEETAITILAEACSAVPEYKKELRMILDFMVAGGVVKREGNMIKLASATTPELAPTIAKPEPSQQPDTATREVRDTVRSDFVQSPQDGVRFNISVNVNMADFANWRPDRLAAFFSGIAAVLAAKADVEKVEKGK